MDINSNISLSTPSSTFTPQDVPVGPVEVGPHHHHHHDDHDQGRVGEEEEYVEETL